MTTKLDKTLKREISVKGQAYVLTISPEGLLLTLKGRRKGKELRWDALVEDEAALAVALNASIGMFQKQTDSTAMAGKLKVARRKKGRMGGR
jgi:hypothetical protein